MSLVGRVLAQARALGPGSFALVMATGIVSVDVSQHGMAWLGRALFGLNLAAYAWLLLLSGLRLARFPREMAEQFATPGRGAAFLTTAAGTCVLGAQCLAVVHWPALARVFAALGALFWTVSIYLFFFVTMVRRHKAPLSHTINGGWLVVVVATQALAVLVALLARESALATREDLLLVAMCLYLVGCAWYLVIITLVVYRMVLLPLHAREFTPPYWINMGALAISTLAGSSIIIDAPSGPLADLVPFVKGFTLFYWASATWWIPLLVMLEVWRLGWSKMPVEYEVDDWDIVFPIGMYTVSTFALAHAIGEPRLLPISAVGVYVSLMVWALVAAAMLRRLLRRARALTSG